MNRIVRCFAAIAPIALAGCAGLPVNSSLDTFNGGFASFTRSDQLAFAPLAPPAPMNTRSDSGWFHGTADDPAYSYGAWYAIMVLAWANGSTFAGIRSPAGAGAAGGPAPAGSLSLYRAGGGGLRLGR